MAIVDSRMKTIANEQLLSESAFSFGLVSLRSLVQQKKNSRKKNVSLFRTSKTLMAVKKQREQRMINQCLFYKRHCIYTFFCKHSIFFLAWMFPYFVCFQLPMFLNF